MASYIRQSTFSDGDLITAELFNNEYNQLVAVFDNATGHKHDGTVGEGPVISIIGDAGLSTPLNKILVDTTNDHIEFYIDVSGTSTQQLYIADGAIVPTTNNDVDLGTSASKFKDLYLSGTANITGNAVVTGNLTVEGTTVTLNTATLDVEDKNITLNYGTGDTSSNADGAGITIQDAVDASTDATILWNAANDRFDFSHAIDVTGTITSDGLTVDAALATINAPSNNADLILTEGGTNTDARIRNSNGILEFDADLNAEFGGSAITFSIDGNQKLSLDRNGALDLTGTATMDGLTVNSGGTSSYLTIRNGSNNSFTKLYSDLNGVTILDVDANNIGAAPRFQIDVSEVQALRITEGGDISFYDDTGTTQGLFWDASTERLGIGTTSPSSTLDVNGTITYGSLSDGTITITGFVDEDNMASDSATLVPTQQSVKAYVDSQVGTVDTLSEILANGNTTGGTDIAVSTGDDITFADSSKAIFGTGSDLSIYHDGNNSYVRESGTGELRVQGTNLRLMSTSEENYLTALENAGVRLWYDNNIKLTTTSTGIDVTGTAVTDGLEARKDTGSTTNSLLKLTNSAGSTTDGVGITFEVANTSGAGGSVNVVRDGSNFKPYMTLNTSANVSTAPSQRVRIDDTGIDVTGTVVSDGLTVDSGASDISIVFDDDNVTNRYKFTTGGNSFDSFFDVNSGSSRAAHVRTISGSVSVDIASGFSRNDINFSNADLFIKRSGTKALEVDHSTGDISFYDDTGASANLTWDASADSLDFVDGAKARFGAGNDFQVEHDGLDTTLKNYTGSLYLQNLADDKDVFIKSDNGSGGAANYFQADGSTGETKLFYYGSEKISTKSTGVQVSGTIESYGVKSVDNLELEADYNGTSSTTYSNIIFKTDGNEVGRFDASGRLGIGTTSPSSPLSVHSAAAGGVAIAEFRSTGNANSVIDLRADGTGDPKIYFDLNGATPFAIGVDNSDGDKFKISGNYQLGTNDRFVIDSSGNVGIGTTSPSTKLEVEGTITFGTANSIIADNNLRFKSSGAAYIDHNTVGQDINFRVSNASSLDTTAMTIDSSGELLAGKTSADNTTAGHRFSPSGFVSHVRSGDTPMLINRLSSDGGLILFRKDGGNVGEIGTNSGYVRIGTGDTHLLYHSGIDTIIPYSGSANRDDAISLGYSGARFKDLHLSGTAYVENLEVSGTTTTINTTNLNVEDNNITINYSTGDSSTTADGAGITIQDAVDASTDATILWNATNDEFDFSHGITLPDNAKATFGTGSDLEIYHDGSNSYIKDVGTGNLIIEGSSQLKLTGPAGDYFMGQNNGSAYLYHAGSLKAYTTSSGIEVTGNITASGTIDINSDSGQLQFGADNDMQIFHNGANGEINISTGSFTIDSPNTITLNADQSGRVLFSDGATNYGRFQKGASSWNFHGLVQNNSFRFLGNDGGTETEVMRIQYDGNIGIGTSSPSAFIHTEGTSNGTETYAKFSTGSLAGDQILTVKSSSARNHMALQVNAGGGAVDDLALNPDGGNVGIGDTSPSSKFVVSDSGGAGLEFIPQTSNDRTTLLSYDRNTSTYQTVDFDGSDIHFNVAGNEKARIDSSGNLLVAQTSQSPNTVGISLNNNGNISAKRDGGIVALFNRATSSGEIISIRKDDTTVGSIGTGGTDLWIGSPAGAGSVGIKLNSKTIIPTTDAGADQDNAIDIGNSSVRFKDLYLSGGHMNGAADSFTFVSGGNASNAGANILLYGQSHSGSANTTVFRASGTETARIDSSGNLLIGQTAGNVYNQSSVSGFKLDGSSGNLQVARSGGTTAFFNRMSNDGTIIDFRKDGSQVGVIGVGASAKMTIIGTNANLQLGANNASLLNLDTNKLYPETDNSVDLGFSSSVKRFRDLYLTGTANVGEITASSTAFTSINIDSSRTSGNIGGVNFRDSTDTIKGQIYGRVEGEVKINHNSNVTTFDASGNLLVGKTVANNDDVGTTIYNSAGMSVARSSGVPLILNRKTNDGTILEIRKDGTGVGSFGTYVGYPFIGKGDTTLLFNPDGDRIIPRGSSGGQRDGAIDLGGTSDRFKDLHLSGTANTGAIKITENSNAMLKSADNIGEVGSGNFALQVSNTDESALKPFGIRAEDIRFATQSSERMRIDSSGNVGIGTSSPSTLIEGRTSTANTAYLTLGTDNAGSSHTVDHDIAALQFYSGDQSGAGSGVKGSIRYKYGSSSGATTHMTFHTAGVSSGNDTERMRIDSSGNVGIGTDSPSSTLHVKGGSTTTQSTFSNFISNSTFRSVVNHANEYGLYMGYANSTTDTSAIQSGRVGGTVDELALNPYGGNVGIGVNGPAYTLHVLDTIGTRTLNLGHGVSSGTITTDTSKPLNFQISGSTKMTLDSSGNLLVSKTSSDLTTDGIELRDTGGIVAIRTNGDPLYLNRKSTDGAIATFAKDGTTIGNIGVVDSDLTIYTSTSGHKGLRFGNGYIAPTDNTGTVTDNTTDLGLSSQRFKDLHLSGIAYTNSIRAAGGSDLQLQTDEGVARIQILDSDGSVGIGTTAPATHLHILGPKDAASSPVVRIQHSLATHTDGPLVDFQNNSQTIRGTIGTRQSETNTNLYITGGNTGLKFLNYITYKAIYPVGSDGSDSDDTTDLGASSVRFDDIYATNGTIQTSDRNEKQDIQELSDAEQRVATACKGLIRRYKFNKAVTEKGDDARYHFGIIAQDLQDAFTAEGLDAGDYGMFISSTWTDDDGVEHTRLGVRYNELLAFIIATL